MRTGLMGKAGNVRITLGSAIELEKISLDINYTLDLMTQLQPLNRVSLGARFNLGDQGRKDAANRLDELYLLGLDSYSISDFENAKNYWEEVLRLEPRFEPAQEGLAIIEKTMAVQQRIRDMSNLY